MRRPAGVMPGRFDGREKGRNTTASPAPRQTQAEGVNARELFMHETVERTTDTGAPSPGSEQAEAKHSVNGAPALARSGGVSPPRPLRIPVKR